MIKPDREDLLKKAERIIKENIYTEENQKLLFPVNNR